MLLKSPSYLATMVQEKGKKNTGKMVSVMVLFHGPALDVGLSSNNPVRSIWVPLLHKHRWRPRWKRPRQGKEPVVTGAWPGKSQITPTSTFR